MATCRKKTYPDPPKRYGMPLIPLALAVVLIGSGCHPDKEVTVWNKEVVLRIVEAPDTCAVGETIPLTLSFENTTTETLMLPIQDDIMSLSNYPTTGFVNSHPLFAVRSDSTFNIHLEGGETRILNLDFEPLDSLELGTYSYDAVYKCTVDFGDSALRLVTGSAPRTIVVVAE